MKKFIIPGLLVSVLGVIVLTIICVCYGFSIYNQAASNQNLYEMKVKDNDSEFDNMWKKISQVCQLADSKKDAFKEIFTGYATARTPQDSGKMMLWVHENAPNLDLSVYDKAQNIIVASRDGFTMRQKEQVQIATTFNDQMVQMPRGFFLKLFGFHKIDVKLITSTRTENARATGHDDDVSLTGMKQQPEKK